MLKRISAIALALVASAVLLPAAAQAQECYRPHGVAYGYHRPAIVYRAPFYRPPVVVYSAPGPAYVGGYWGPVGYRAPVWHRDWHREWRGRGYR